MGSSETRVGGTTMLGMIRMTESKVQEQGSRLIAEKRGRGVPSWPLEESGVGSLPSALCLRARRQ